MNSKRSFDTIYRQLQDIHTPLLTNDSKYSYSTTIQVGKVIQHPANYWIFDHNIDDKTFQEIQRRFQKLCDNTFIKKTTSNDKVYIHNDVRIICNNNNNNNNNNHNASHKTPKIHKSVQINNLIDFSCENGYDIRIVQEKYTEPTTNIECIHTYDSIEETETTIYDFYDAICVEFITTHPTPYTPHTTHTPHQTHTTQIRIDNELNLDDEDTQQLFNQLMLILNFEISTEKIAVLRKFCQ